MTYGNGTICDVNDVKIWKFLDQLYFFNAQELFHNLGTTLRILSDFGKLKVTPQKCSTYIKLYCKTLCEFDDMIDVQMFHKIMTKVGEMFGARVSAYDIPKLFNPQIPDLPSVQESGAAYSYIYNHEQFPTYTLCKHGIYIPLLQGETITCRSIWNKVSNNYNESNNPYLANDEDTQLCGPGLGNLIG